jgi:hypothetical protein
MSRIAVIVRRAAHVHILRNVNDVSTGAASADRGIPVLPPLVRRRIE